MDIEHDTLVWFSKSFGLFYLISLSIVAVFYALRPSQKSVFDRAARSILEKDDKP